MGMREEMMSGRLYDGNNRELLDELYRAQELCQAYNALRLTDFEGRKQVLDKLIPKHGKGLSIVPPFYCDYGTNIECGDHVFINCCCVFLDEALIKIGSNVFIAPQCGFYTAGHPLDKEMRRKNIQYSLPITIGDDVWIGGMVTIMPGVSIGSGSVIAGGSVVTRDIPEGVLAAGNPCHVIRKISEVDRDKFKRV